MRTFSNALRPTSAPIAIAAAADDDDDDDDDNDNKLALFY